MKSLYLGVVLAMVGTLSLSLLVFMTISDHVQKSYLYPVFEAMDELELESARGALDKGGSAAVSSYMARLNRLFTGSHYLLDSRGIDLVSGQNRSALLPRPPSRESRGFVILRCERFIYRRCDLFQRWAVVYRAQGAIVRADYALEANARPVLPELSPCYPKSGSRILKAVGWAPTWVKVVPKLKGKRHHRH